MKKERSTTLTTVYSYLRILQRADCPPEAKAACIAGIAEALDVDPDRVRNALVRPRQPQDGLPCHE